MRVVSRPELSRQPRRGFAGLA